ncbi:hypothetical protein MA16_Dca022752 [Dendrobium catenatum]|uniref:Uncharacterized protein n=1 Tax=Dendrobium catenatum TaxID=906689 RepID=A0A2I0XJM2_9ASPA|nr:hypothetical protein MA16_Dca022752 [Dendrobium catenatum]
MLDLSMYKNYVCRIATTSLSISQTSLKKVLNFLTVLGNFPNYFLGCFYVGFDFKLALKFEVRSPESET